MTTQFSKRETLPMLLRQLGTCLLVLSGVVFMLEGWHQLSSIGRYGAFLAFSLGLAGAGVFCARRLGETKTARAFLALAAATLSVHFSELGAMLYALVTPAPSTLPRMLVVSVEDPRLVALLMAAGLVAAVPLAALGFAALCRPQARALSLVNVAVCAMLLVPTRQSLPVAILVLVGSALVTLVDLWQLGVESRMTTAEGAIVRALLWAPVATMIGRALLYPVSGAFLGFLLILVSAYLFFFLAARVGLAAGLILQKLALFGFGAGWWLVARSLVSPAWLAPYDSLGYYLPVAGVVGGLSFAAPTLVHRRSLRAIAGYLLALAVFQLTLSPGDGIAGFIGVVLGVVLLIAGWSLKETHPLVAGVVCFLMGAIGEIVSAIELWARAPWLGLGILGVAVLLGASYLEKHADRLVSGWRRARERFQR